MKSHVIVAVLTASSLITACDNSNSGLSFHAGWFGADNYDECFLDAMEGVTSDVAAKQIMKICRKKFPMTEKEILDSTSLKGHVYLTKGGGDVNVAAGKTVYLIPEASIENLLFREVSKVSKDIDSNVKEAAHKTCNEAVKYISEKIELNKNELNELNKAKEIELMNCAPVEETITKKTKEVESYAKEFNQKRKELSEELNSLLATKKSAVRKKANEIKKQQIDKLKIRIMNYSLNDSGYTKIKITNTSEYCVKDLKKLSFYSKNKKVSSTSYFMTSNKEDKYGFDMKCIIPPGMSLTASPTNGTSDVNYDAEDKLFAETHKLPITNGHIVIDKVKIESIGDVNFHTKPVGKKNGKKIVYTTKDVSFNDLALNRYKYAQDKKIKGLKKSIAKLDNERNQNKDFQIIKEKNIELSQCKLNNEKYKEYYKALEDNAAIGNTLNVYTNDLKVCRNMNSDFGKAERTLINVNQKYSTSFSIYKNIDLSKYKSLIKDRISNSVIGMNITKVDADISGKFSFGKVKAGNYFIYTTYQDSFNEVFWLSPIALKGEVGFDLNNNNLKYGSLDFYLDHQLDSVCYSCPIKEFKESLLTDEEIKGKYKRHREGLEELNKQIRKLKRLLR